MALGIVAASCLLPTTLQAVSVFEILHADPNLATRKASGDLKISHDSYTNDAEIKHVVKSWCQKQRKAEKEHDDYQQRAKKLKQHCAELQNKRELLEISPPVLSIPSLNMLQRHQQMLRTGDVLIAYNQQLQNYTVDMSKEMTRFGEIYQKIAEIHQALKDTGADGRMPTAVSDHVAVHVAESDEVLQAKRKYYEAQLKNLECQKSYYLTKLKNITLKIDYVYQRHQLLAQCQQEVLGSIGDASTPKSDLAHCLQRNCEYSAQHANLVRSLKETMVSRLEVPRSIDIVNQVIARIAKLSSARFSGQVQRATISELTKQPDLQRINQRIVQLNVQRLHYEHALQNVEGSFEAVRTNGRVDRQSQELEKERTQEHQLLTWLTNACDAAITVQEQLKDANRELMRAQGKLQKVAVQHVFWMTDVERANLAFPVKFVKDIKKLLQKDIKWSDNLRVLVSSDDNIGVLAIALVLAMLRWGACHRYRDFLQHAAARVGNVTHDNFSLTASKVGWSLLMALPLPILTLAIGYCLKNFTHEVAAGVRATVPLLLASGVCANFSHPQGLFIKHFGWEQTRVTRVAHYYKLVVWLAVPLIIMTIVFNHLDDHAFAGTLGRTSFMLLCATLTVFTLKVNRAQLPFYRNRRGLVQNVINQAVWAVLISAPLLALLFSMLGYLAAAQELLLRLAGSIGIWFGLLVIYRLIWRWMLIQRRRIAFDRAKQRRAGKLAQRARIEEEPSRADHNLEMQLIDLDTISSRSSQLLRSMIAMATLFSLIWWWSKMHPAFGFLETVPLWSGENVAQGAYNLQSMTLGRGLRMVVLLVITTQLVRNLPALLELALLQHLELSPGTGYAITTLTKYLIVLVGCLVGIDFLGIDWPKIQWVATALGVGLGFGLKDIFANFISGLILLFEKPIRIGDTVTVRELTGIVTKINTRATVITDWDRKEVIVPNHALITEQFINWTLADSVTRMVLQIGAPAEVDPLFIKKLIKRAAKKCALLLDNPPLDIYLNELRQGIQCFEVRLYTAELGHRMPLRHEFHQRLLALYRRYHIVLPYPPAQIRIEPMMPECNTARVTPATRRTTA